MLNSGKQFRALPDKKNNILTLMLSEKILNETKNHNPPPCKLNGRSLTVLASTLLFGKVFLSLKHIIVTQQMIS